MRDLVDHGGAIRHLDPGQGLQPGRTEEPGPAASPRQGHAEEHVAVGHRRLAGHDGLCPRHGDVTGAHARLATTTALPRPIEARAAIKDAAFYPLNANPTVGATSATIRSSGHSMKVDGRARQDRQRVSRRSRATLTE
jgi:hypothetical protein